MSRFGEGDGEEFAGQSFLWEANAKRAIEGRRGQRALRDLEAALLDLPEKKLIHGHLAHQGQVCAIGALVTHRRIQKGEDRDAILRDLEALAPTLCECGHPEREHVGGVCGGCIDAARWWNDARNHPDNADRLSYDGLPWFHPSHAPRLCTTFVDTEETDDDYGDVTVEAGKTVGLTYVLAWEIAWRNDERYSSLSDDERYERTLAWVRERIKPEPAAA